MNIRIVFTGRFYHTADALPDEITLPEGATVDEALEEVFKYLPDENPLPRSCLVVLSGQHLGSLGDHKPAPLYDGNELVLIAPVAGG